MAKYQIKGNELFYSQLDLKKFKVFQCSVNLLTKPTSVSPGCDPLWQSTKIVAL